MADEPKPEEKKSDEAKPSLITTLAMWGAFIIILIVLISAAWPHDSDTFSPIEPHVVIAVPTDTPLPTPTAEPFDVTTGVIGRTYEVEWGEMLYQYSRDVSFYNLTNEKGENIFFGTFFDFAANSAQRPDDRPGLQLQGGVWRQNRSEITLDYSTTYDHAELVDFQTGNVSRYQYHETFRCLDIDCKNLTGVFGTYNLLWDEGDLTRWTTTNMSYVGMDFNETVERAIALNQSSVMTAAYPNRTGG